MLRQKNKKISRGVDKLAAFIVDAIAQKESETKLVRERNAAMEGLERFRGVKEHRARAEKNSSKMRGEIALKAAMERWLKSP